MPLGFDSLSRGHIPVGFFNIDTDCFCIDDHFIFASDLCAAISGWVQAGEAFEDEEEQEAGADEVETGQAEAGAESPTAGEAGADEAGKAKAEAQSEANIDTTLEFHILPPKSIGSLHGAIQGTLLTGFIGEVYRLFPFPARQEDFKQQPEGDANREPVERLLLQYAPAQAIPITSHRDTDIISIGDIILSRAVFHQVLDYIDGGGMPGWRDGLKPDYVVAMGEAVRQKGNWLFEKLG